MGDPAAEGRPVQSTLGGDNGRAWAINDASRVVGGSQTAGGDRHATLWSVSLIDLTPLEEIDMVESRLEELLEETEL